MSSPTKCIYLKKQQQQQRCNDLAFKQTTLPEFLHVDVKGWRRPNKLFQLTILINSTEMLLACPIPLLNIYFFRSMYAFISRKYYFYLRPPVKNESLNTIQMPADTK